MERFEPLSGGCARPAERKSSRISKGRSFTTAAEERINEDTRFVIVRAIIYPTRAFRHSWVSSSNPSSTAPTEGCRAESCGTLGGAAFGGICR